MMWAPQYHCNITQLFFCHYHNTLVSRWLLVTGNLCTKQRSTSSQTGFCEWQFGLFKLNELYKLYCLFKGWTCILLVCKFASYWILSTNTITHANNSSERNTWLCWKNNVLCLWVAKECALKFSPELLKNDKHHLNKPEAFLNSK